MPSIRGENMDAGVSIAIRHKRGSIRRDGNIRRVVERSLRRRLVFGAELAERSAIGGEDRDDVTVAVGDVHIPFESTVTPCGSTTTPSPRLPVTDPDASSTKTVGPRR